jgi:hypothetical protein
MSIFTSHVALAAVLDDVQRRGIERALEAAAGECRDVHIPAEMRQLA